MPPRYITDPRRDFLPGCVSAAGTCLPPFVIFDRQTLNPEMVRGEVPGSVYVIDKGMDKPRAVRVLVQEALPRLCSIYTSFAATYGRAFIPLLPGSDQDG